LLRVSKAAKSIIKYGDNISKLKLRGKSLTSGMKMLKKMGLDMRITKTGRIEFFDPKTGVVRAAWDPVKKWTSHWHKFSPDGKLPLNDAGHVVEKQMPKAHIPSN